MNLTNTPFSDHQKTDFKDVFTATLLGCSLAFRVNATQADDTPLKRIQTSRALFEIGIEHQDPLLILAAAQLHKTVGIYPTKPALQVGIAVDGTRLVGTDMLDAASPVKHTGGKVGLVAFLAV